MDKEQRTKHKKVKQGHANHKPSIEKKKNFHGKKKGYRASIQHFQSRTVYAFVLNKLCRKSEKQKSKKGKRKEKEIEKATIKTLAVSSDSKMLLLHCPHHSVTKS
jgi:hypothetical protein